MKTMANDVLYNIFKDHLQPSKTETIDSRITEAIQFINDHLAEILTLEKVANHIYLSPERTRHLFLDNVEMPFSQYVLWKRIKTVLTSVVEGRQTFFEASLQYGFTDQTHFNKFFKRMFGTTATKVLKNCTFLQFN
jgi:AraC-like DNA-binding protein